MHASRVHHGLSEGEKSPLLPVGANTRLDLLSAARAMALVGGTVGVSVHASIDLAAGELDADEGARGGVIPRRALGWRRARLRSARDVQVLAAHGCLPRRR